MLHGTTVLVVEEEFLIALDIQRMLEALGAGEIFFARSAAEARRQQELWAGAGLAIIDMALHRAAALELIPQLLAGGVPVVLCSADAGLKHLGVPQFPNLPVVTKPMAETDLVHAIGKVFSSPV